MDDGGRLHLHWQVLPGRRIALARLPRLRVHNRFSRAVVADERERFKRYFDRSRGVAVVERWRGGGIEPGAEALSLRRARTVS